MWVTCTQVLAISCWWGLTRAKQPSMVANSPAHILLGDLKGCTWGSRWFLALETHVTKVKQTNAGGRMKQANERSTVYHPPAWRWWHTCNVQNPIMLLCTMYHVTIVLYALWGFHCKASVYLNTFVWYSNMVRLSVYINRINHFLT